MTKSDVRTHPVVVLCCQCVSVWYALDACDDEDKDVDDDDGHAVMLIMEIKKIKKTMNMMKIYNDFVDFTPRKLCTRIVGMGTK